ncbi:glycosyltransferase family 2 protein [Pontibacillus salicampi]|uniref:Glycosyltransferase family 2 protein n=1 Tax=Pontibacillus salicampi TaxID=1449801 RepID=A0ABV6LSC4_9BACI
MVDLSIIIPVYNLDKYLHECINSLVYQKESRYTYELVFVNDGSNDNSLKILSNFKECYPDIIHVYSIKNSGVSYARNYGIQKSNGKFIAFVDGDDWVSKDFVYRTLDKIVNKDIQFVISYMAHVYGQKTLNEKEEINKFLFNLENHVTGKIFDREILQNNQVVFPENVKIGEDFAFLFSYILLIDNYEIIHEPLYFYRREREGSAMSSKSNSNLFLDINSACEKLLSFASDKQILIENEREIEYLFIKNVIARTIPKIVKNNFPNYKLIKKLVKKEYTFVEQYFPDWCNNPYFTEDIESYFKENVGSKYLENLTLMRNPKASHFVKLYIDNKIRR